MTDVRLRDRFGMTPERQPGRSRRSFECYADDNGLQARYGMTLMK
jgi:hypothetical protein